MAASPPISAEFDGSQLRARVEDLEKAVAEQRALLSEMGAVVSDYRQRLKQAEAERDLLRETSIGLRNRLDDQAQSHAESARPSANANALNTAEASAYTGLSKGRLDNLRFAGGGPKFMKLGRSVRYRVSDLDEWMSDRIVENTSMLPRKA